MNRLISRSFLPGLLIAVAAGGIPSAFAAATLPISQVPLFRAQAVPPLNMLVMGKDLKLFSEAYNDASDLNGDGVLDVGYKPDQITYLGYFNSKVCYSYDGTKYVPAAVGGGLNLKQCSGNWSGDFLNYVTTSRMDALRRVLDGGKRSTDTAIDTILERSYIPQDSISWAKEYQSVARDGYDVSNYTPYAAPPATQYILFGNVTLLRSGAGEPLLRVLKNTPYRVWEWASTEQPVLTNNCTSAHISCGVGSSFTDYVVRVVSCPSSNAAFRESTCKQYPNGDWKPTGILHDYGETGKMAFGLITGSMFNNFEGGVLRQNIEDFSTEIDPNTGQFLTAVNGIVNTINAFRLLGFGSDALVTPGGPYDWYNWPGSNCTSFVNGNRTSVNGECRAWGNPIGEMMYETMRYFAGAASATPRYATGGAPIGNTEETLLGLPTATWKDPYAAKPTGLGYKACAKPYETVISDVNPSRDSGLPGNPFGEAAPNGTTPAAISGLSMVTEGQRIWNNEFSGSKQVFIGQSGGVYDSAPSAKTVTSFGNIRGLAPEEPSREGSYSASIVASYGLANDLSGATAQKHFLRTYGVAVASPLPKIEFPAGLGKTISLVPFAKSVSGCFVNTAGAFQPTDQIADFYVEKINNLPGAPFDITVNGGLPFAAFRINYEDQEQGSDHDMDAIERYQVQLNLDGTVSVNVASQYAAGCVDQAMGYVISGTSKDGVYLEVRDTDSNPASAIKYKLNTPPGRDPGYCSAGPGAPADCAPLPTTATRIFTASSGSSATVLKDPLWYAAKYGGYTDANSNGVPDPGEWDKNVSGTPDNYFLVTNPLSLKAQLSKAFDSIIVDNNKSSGALTDTGARISAGSLSYSTTYSIDASGSNWTGNLFAKRITTAGDFGVDVWNASANLDNAAAIAARQSKIFIVTTPGKSGTRVASGFTSAAIAAAFGGSDSAQLAFLGLTRGGVEAQYGTGGAPPTVTVASIIDYLKGIATLEQKNTGKFRNRSSVIGDFINSKPVVAGPKDDYGYSLLPAALGGGASGGGTYGQYLLDKSTSNPTVFAGANDGMLHAFDARDIGGNELFGFIPNSVAKKLGKLLDPGYTHEYYVDGEINVADARLGSNWATVLVSSAGAGGQGVFALDVTDPSIFSGSKVLWEATAADAIYGNDVGYSIGKPQVILGEDGLWYAVFGNGFNSINSNPVLFVVDLQSGVVKTITANDGGAFTNGIGQIAAVDTNGDGEVDAVYGGDYRGNLWKFDLSAISAASWNVGNGGKPLFTAADGSGNSQPIASSLEIAAGPLGGQMIYFGTGTYFLTTDNSVPASPPVQSLYAVWDKNNTAAPFVTYDRSNLVAQTIVSETAGPPFTTRSTSSNAVSFSFAAASKQGWYMDLVVAAGPAKGERFFGTPRVQNGVVFFTTFEPNTDECNPGGTRWEYGLSALSGANALSQIRVGTLTGTPVCPLGSCGAVQIGKGAPVRETSVVIPKNICPPGSAGCPADPIPCDPTKPGCTVPEPTDTSLYSACTLVIRNGSEIAPLALPRPCGRQSWRQVR